MKRTTVKTLFRWALALSSLMLVQVASARATISDMQSCQGLIDFLQIRVNSTSNRFQKTDINTILTGLEVYDRYIQNHIVTPGLLSFNQGDESKAETMQDKVDEYKKSLVKGYQQRFPENKLYMDFAVSLNNCAQKAVPQGAELEAFKSSILTLVNITKNQ
ncbi:hypothetical protein [uncultured Pseudoteredinibacter sp.]|uniref:hypothetical protein n=1 Tax=uncultured Pseudoteredinibacter sp. TaxID=1641701 RepID=UPI00262F4308|nr:hypothetical protein [uncultured Pseudoteredinibacter sp.]